MSLQRVALPLVLLLSACGAQISDGAGANLTGSDIDAGDSRGSGGDGSGSSAPPIDAGATCAARVLYLNFEGQTLTRTLVSDATKNQASWVQTATGTAPPYHQNDTDRATQIQTIVDGVRGQLAQFPVTVVTTRPATGSYIMVVLGGQSRDIGSAYSAAVNTLDCGDLVANDVAWIADGATPGQHVINLVLGAVGFGIGLTAVNDPNDCMCGWADACQSNDTVACKLGAPVTRDPAADQLCSAAGATQNEVTAMHDAFCGKP